MSMGTTFDEFILEQFGRYLHTTGTVKSAESLRDYLLSVDMFAREAGKDFLRSITEYKQFHWTLESLAARTQWPDGRRKKPWGSRMIKKVADELTVFWAWAYKFQYSKHNPVGEGNLFRKGPGKPPEFFDWNDPDFQKLLNDPNNTVKRRAIYHLLRSSGIRPIEFEKLEKRHYKFDYVELVKRKGGQPGFAPVDALARKVIDEYLECLNWHYKGNCLFPKDDYSGPINKHGLWKLLYNHGKKMGVHFYPYRLRHSLAGELAERGIDPMTISEVYGHSDPRTTQIYFHLSKEKIKNVYSR